MNRVSSLPMWSVLSQQQWQGQFRHRCRCANPCSKASAGLLSLCRTWAEPRGCARRDECNAGTAAQPHHCGWLRYSGGQSGLCLQQGHAQAPGAMCSGLLGVVQRKMHARISIQARATCQNCPVHQGLGLLTAIAHPDCSRSQLVVRAAAGQGACHPEGQCAAAAALLCARWRHPARPLSGHWTGVEQAC